MVENLWTLILEGLRDTIDPDEYRRWFRTSSQASDSGDQISVWVPYASDGRHIASCYTDVIQRELERLGRHNVHIRFVATGDPDEDDDSDA